jgi:hypothetical protein
LDEASAYSNVQGIERLFEQARSAHVSLVAATQVLSGFAQTNRAQLDFIMGNTATKVIMALGDFVSAETMAKTIGEELAGFATQSTTKNRGTSAAWISPLPSRTSQAKSDATGTMQRYDYIVRPEHLLNQATGQAVVFTRDPELGGRLYMNGRTCLTRIPMDGDMSMPRLPRVGPAGLDLLNLLQRGTMNGASPSNAPGRRPAAPGVSNDGQQGQEDTTLAAPTRPRRRRAVRRRETADTIILEPQE